MGLMEKIGRWHTLAQQLKEIKAEEMQLRKEICGHILQNKVPPCSDVLTFSGSDTILEAKQTVSHNIDEAALQSMVGDLDLEERNCIKYKPSLVLRPYKKLPDTSILHDAVIVKPSAPTLKVKEA
jgi:hypothetical protein